MSRPPTSAERAPGTAALRTVDPIIAAGGPELGRLMADAETRLRGIAGAHGEPLSRHASLTLAAGGKRMRPLLVFLCAARAASTELVSAAVAVELLHMATLVHDDVLDRAELRRGRPTVFVADGRHAATATGDFLFSRAFAELVATGSRAGVRSLSEAASALARGELMQRADAFSDSVTPERYLDRCMHKTGRLFEAACALGALLGAPGEHGAPALAAFGARIGLAFQILDDVLDVEGPTERIGKHRGTDLLDGTVTLPLILARNRDARVRALELRAIESAAQADAACELIARTGALEDSRQAALSHVDEAKEALRSAPLSDEGRRVLGLVADAVVDRYA